jgi:hypothetical protein
MGSALGIVIVVLVGIVLIVGIVTTFSNDSAYEQIGRGGTEIGPLRPAAPAPAAGRAEMRAEVLQMLQARNDRRIRRGQAPLDIEAEATRLLDAPTGGSADAELVEEVRQLVIARNARRARQGKAALDVEAEVERELRELGA